MDGGVKKVFISMRISWRMKLDEVLEKRRCVRKFKDKAVKESVILEIANSALKAPCAGNIFSVRMILVDDAEKKKKIAEACLEQDFMAKAPHLIVVVSEKQQTKKMYGKFSENYIKQQAGAAIENMFLKIVDLGLSTCWIGAFEEKSLKRVLDIPEDVDVEAILPIGYADEKADEKLFKPELKSIIRINSYKAKPTRPKRIES
jgi:hypothetical protein